MAQTPPGPGTRLPQSGKTPNTGSLPDTSTDTSISSSSSVGSGDEESTSRARLEQGAGRAREEAERIGGQAAEQARGMVEEQKGVFAKEIRGLAKALHQTAEKLGEQDQRPLAGYADRAAQSLERFAGSLQERSGESLLHQAQDYARRQPAMFIGGAVAAGLVLSRFLKSSSDTHRGSASRSGASGKRSDESSPFPSSSPLLQGGSMDELDERADKSVGMSATSPSTHPSATKDGGDTAKKPGGTDEGR